jgi:hypothetical protein
MNRRQLSRFLAGTVVTWHVMGPDAVPAAAGTGGTPVDAPGLVGDQSWVSPQFGFGVTWQAPWILADNPSTSPLMDNLSLTLNDPGGGLDSLEIDGVALEDESPGEAMRNLMEYWESPQFAHNMGAAGEVDVVLTDATDTHAAALATWQEHGVGQLVRLVETHVSEDERWYVQAGLLVVVDAFVDLYTHVEGQIRIDGDAPYLVFERTDLINAIGKIQA